MTYHTTLNLLQIKKEVLLKVNSGELGVIAGASLLRITRQGFWKLRRRFNQFGYQALLGRKRGPKPYIRIHNRTPLLIEDKVEEIYHKYDCGIDTLLWIIEDDYQNELALTKLSRSTIYRILVRRRLINPKTGKINQHPHKYTKGYPGEEVQIDTTEPFGKSKGTMLNIIDDYSRWKRSYFYQGNSSLKAKICFKDFKDTAPFPVEGARVDNGSEFKKYFKTYCKVNNIRLINNPIRTPEHNGKVERLHRTVEAECLWRTKLNEIGDLQLVNYRLKQHDNWYNTKRRHLGYRMNKLTPQQKIEQWILDNNNKHPFTVDVNETLILYIKTIINSKLYNLTKYDSN